jgi:hypothetical protein
MRRIHAFWVCLAVSSLLVAAAHPAEAQVRKGIQGGMSIDPDQVFFGGHIETSPLVDNLRFRPNVDVGLGDNATSIGLNFDFTYMFTAGKPWNIYAGAGPAINWFNVDDSSEMDGGFNIILGTRQRDGMFFELKVGAVGSPDLKFGVGFTFR